ncbi:hypothetical protein [Caldanaerobius fijiensis]|uniref:hypothetical protein n=1 Tax=Caldanaerobius fijiensis TaxID=456330 RepID=UPI000932DEF4|nr:hypothetical protein [Caldanaerobius fijiensis]
MKGIFVVMDINVQKTARQAAFFMPSGRKGAEPYAGRLHNRPDCWRLFGCAFDVHVLCGEKGR